MALTATDLFNDATTREIGGVGPDQVNLIVSDLIGVQQQLSAADPQINNLTDLHTHVIINQLNEEIASVENANAPTTGTITLGTDLGQFVGRAINDIHRDIIDIAQGDPGVQAIFNPTPLPDLNTPAAPFLDNTDQTAFITQWIQDSNHLGQAAITIENNGFTGDIAGLVQQIETYATNANAFDQSQGGLWSARFWNEFRSDGTTGTAAAALIDGLQTHNAGEVNAAADQLAANSADVGGNNLKADGGSYADVVAAAQATAVTPNPTPGGGGGGAGDQGGGGTGGQVSGGTGGQGGGTGGQGSVGATCAGDQPGTGTSTSHQDAHSGHAGDSIASDLAALIQAMQHGNASAVNDAVTELTTAVQNNAGGAGAMADALAHASGGADHGGHHFEHLWS